MKIASFFAGVGGIELGLGGEVVYANEFDKNAIKTYELNHNLKVDSRDISQVSPHELPSFDLLCAGFPCQAFSIAGYQKGFNDERGGLFFELLRFINAKRPRVLLLENVKNLTKHNKGKSFATILSALAGLGYHTRHAVLNAAQYGNTPQNRERVYIVAFRDKAQCERFKFPQPSNDLLKFDDVLNLSQREPSKYYYTNQSKIYAAVVSAVCRTGVFYQWRRKYIRENKSGLCPTLTANMGTGGHNVPIILDTFGIRKLTPRECFRLMGFDDDFALPNIADCHLYKQAGNSVCVGVVRRIGEQIIKF